MSACVEWTMARTNHGYGQRRINNKIQMAHRLAWEEAHGPIPDGMWVLHRCDNPPCINIEHLFLGTQSDNMRDMYAKGYGFGGAKGERNRSAKLTADQAAAIRSSTEPTRVLVERYGVERSTIKRIRSGRTWQASK